MQADDMRNDDGAAYSEVVVAAMHVQNAMLTYSHSRQGYMIRTERR